MLDKYRNKEGFIDLNNTTYKADISERFKLIIDGVGYYFKYTTPEMLYNELIAEELGESVAKINGVVTFYSHFSIEPKGQHIIGVCLGTACYVNGSQTILDLLVEMTGSPVNGTSEDGLFSIDATRCMGACGLAPVVSVDGTVYGCTNQLEELKMLILDYKKEEMLNAA